MTLSFRAEFRLEKCIVVSSTIAGGLGSIASSDPSFLWAKTNTEKGEGGGLGGWCQMVMIEALRGGQRL